MINKNYPNTARLSFYNSKRDEKENKEIYTDGIFSRSCINAYEYKYVVSISLEDS